LKIKRKENDLPLYTKKGTVQKMNDKDNTSIYELTSLYVLVRFAVYNFLVLWKLYLFFEFLRAILRNQLLSMLWDFSNSLRFCKNVERRYACYKRSFRESVQRRGKGYKSYILVCRIRKFNLFSPNS